jgi:hypothetical protein
MPVARTATPERITAVTSNFFFWQGLRWVPLGVALLVAALLRDSASGIPESWRSAIIIVVMLVAFAVSSATGRWYARVFGRVRGIPGQHARRTRTKWLVVYPALVLALLVDGMIRPPILFSGIAFAASIEAYRRSTGGGRRHYVIASAVFALLTFAPLAGIAPRGINSLTLLFGVLGATYVIGGVLDHFELTRILPNVANRDETPGDVMAGAGGAR